MTILAIGLDIVDVSRVAGMLTRYRDRAMARLLTERERRYCESRASTEQHVAARIAAKEAAYKALSGDGDEGYISWQEVEVVRGRGGKPTLEFRGRARATARQLGVCDALVSLTHTDGQAAAVVILVGGNEA